MRLWNDLDTYKGGMMKIDTTRRNPRYIIERGKDGLECLDILVGYLELYSAFSNECAAAINGLRDFFKMLELNGLFEDGGNDE